MEDNITNLIMLRELNHSINKSIYIKSLGPHLAFSKLSAAAVSMLVVEAAGPETTEVQEVPRLTQDPLVFAQFK